MEPMILGFERAGILLFILSAILSAGIIVFAGFAGLIGGVRYLAAGLALRIRRSLAESRAIASGRSVGPALSYRAAHLPAALFAVVQGLVPCSCAVQPIAKAGDKPLHYTSRVHVVGEVKR